MSIDFDVLAAKQPDRLLAMIERGEFESMDDFSWACEACEVLRDKAARVAELLVPLLTHEDLVLREGVIYGLSSTLDKYPEIRKRFEDMRATAPGGIRAALNYVLSGDYDGSD